MTVRNQRANNINEKIQYITPDGIVFNLHDPPDRSVLMYEGDGMPNMDIGTTSGPYQHGETATEVRLLPRTLDMVIRQNGCDRDAYWELRTLIDNMLRPNRTDMNAPLPGVLRRIMNNGNVRDLDVFVSKGPLYTGSHGGWDEFSVSETLRFTAFNPVVYDPVSQSQTSSVLFADPPYFTDITFPFVFPFVFETIAVVSSTIFAINYKGNWESYPVITITGPATDFKIEHQELGDIIDLVGYTINPGQSVLIDLNYAKKTLIDSNGDSWLGKVSDTSTLTSFRIEADPIVPNGLNTFLVSCSLGSADTSVIFEYKNRFVGVDNNV